MTQLEIATLRFILITALLATNPSGTPSEVIVKDAEILLKFILAY